MSEERGDYNLEDKTLVSIFDRPAIRVKDFRRMRSIALNLAAFAEANGASAALCQEIVELKEIINAQANSQGKPGRS